MSSFDYEVGKVLNKHADSDDNTLYKNLRRLRYGSSDKFSEKEIHESLSDLYLFYDDSPSLRLRAFLRNSYEIHNNFPSKMLLVDKYNSDGILVLKQDSMIYVVHPNNKIASRETNPIQVSKWILDRGVVGDSLYPNVEKAIQEEGLISKEIIKEEDVCAIEENILEAENAYQKRQKEFTGEYNLN
jgi:hypothetical protein